MHGLGRDWRRLVGGWRRANLEIARSRSETIERRLHVCPDQRQPHRIQQAGKSRRYQKYDAKPRSTKSMRFQCSLEFLIHTGGNLTHQSKPGEFDGMDQVLKSVRAKDVFYVPGEARHFRG